VNIRMSRSCFCCSDLRAFLNAMTRLQFLSVIFGLAGGFTGTGVDSPAVFDVLI